ncbi:mucin-2-like [Paramacrobiotus metropolitanus]|uniref:mucin-2-like n=1 Tax=Paramacrobiotus metropolitanus TaxID=2943436 RepID=UPI002446221A|nr:mucin-2-like [Paramacrobiotus metropolitanus]
MLSENLNIHPLTFGSQTDDVVAYEMEVTNSSEPIGDALPTTGNVTLTAETLHTDPDGGINPIHVQVVQMEGTTIHEEEGHEPYFEKHSSNVSAEAVTSGGIATVHPTPYSTVWPLTVSLLMGSLTYLATTSPSTESSTTEKKTTVTSTSDNVTHVPATTLPVITDLETSSSSPIETTAATISLAENHTVTETVLTTPSLPDVHTSIDFVPVTETTISSETVAPTALSENEQFGKVKDFDELEIVELSTVAGPSAVTDSSAYDIVQIVYATQPETPVTEPVLIKESVTTGAPTGTTLVSTITTGTSEPSQTTGSTTTDTTRAGTDHPSPEMTGPHLLNNLNGTVLTTSIPPETILPEISAATHSTDAVVESSAVTDSPATTAHGQKVSDSQSSSPTPFFTADRVAFVHYDVPLGTGLTASSIHDSSFLDKLNWTIYQVARERLQERSETNGTTAALTTSVELTGLSISNQSMQPTITVYALANQTAVFTPSEFRVIIQAALHLLDAHNAATLYAGYIPHSPGIIMFIAALCVIVVILLGIVIILARSSHSRYRLDSPFSDGPPSTSHNCSLMVSAFDNPMFQDSSSELCPADDIVSLQPSTCAVTDNAASSERVYSTVRSSDLSHRSGSHPSIARIRTTSTFKQLTNGGTL